MNRNHIILTFFFFCTVDAKSNVLEFPSTEGWYFQSHVALTFSGTEALRKDNRPFTTPASKNIFVEYFHNKDGRIARFMTKDGIVVMEILDPLPVDNNANYWVKGVNRVGSIGWGHTVSFYLQPMLPGVLFDQWRETKYLEQQVTSDTLRMKERVDQSSIRFTLAQFEHDCIQRLTTFSFDAGTTYGFENKGVWADEILSAGQMNELALFTPLREDVKFTYADSSISWPSQWEYTVPQYVQVSGKLDSAKPIPPELTYAKIKEEWTRDLKPMQRGSIAEKKPENKAFVKYISSGVLLFLFLLVGVWYYRKGREES